MFQHLLVFTLVEEGTPRTCYSSSYNPFKENMTLFMGLGMGFGDEVLGDQCSILVGCSC